MNNKVWVKNGVSCTLLCVCTLPLNDCGWNSGSTLTAGVNWLWFRHGKSTLGWKLCTLAVSVLQILWVIGHKVKYPKVSQKEKKKIWKFLFWDNWFGIVHFVMASWSCWTPQVASCTGKSSHMGELLVGKQRAQFGRSPFKETSLPRLALKRSTDSVASHEMFRFWSHRRFPTDICASIRFSAKSNPPSAEDSEVSHPLTVT